MRKITIVVFCGALLLAASCQKKQANFETDDIKMTDVNHLVVNDDSKFTGEVWDESHRMCIAKEKSEQSHFYDENGNEISRAEFGKKYRKMITELEIR